jgi:hypothetical protein
MKRNEGHKPYKVPDSKSQCGLKPEIVFPNSKAVYTVDLIDVLKAYRRAGQ